MGAALVRQSIPPFVETKTNGLRLAYVKATRIFPSAEETTEENRLEGILVFHVSPQSVELSKPPLPGAAYHLCPSAVEAAHTHRAVLFVRQVTPPLVLENSPLSLPASKASPSAEGTRKLWIIGPLVVR